MVLKFAIRFAIALPLFVVVLAFGAVILAAGLLNPSGARGSPLQALDSFVHRGES
jgi:hypothetical protein